MSTAAILLVAGGTAIGAKILADRGKESGADHLGARTITSSTTVGKLRASRVSGTAGVRTSAAAPAGSFRKQYNSDVPAEIEKALRDKAIAEWNKLSADGKKAACATLKKQFPTSAEVQGLDCSAPSFDALVSAAGFALGSAVGGPVGGAIGAVVATYAAGKLEEWADDIWADWQETTPAEAAEVCARLKSYGSADAAKLNAGSVYKACRDRGYLPVW